MAIDLSMSPHVVGINLGPTAMAARLACLEALEREGKPTALIGYSLMARWLERSELNELLFDYEYGANVQHCLQLARGSFHESRGRVLFAACYEEPTAHLEPDGEAFFHFPPQTETLEKTLLEGHQCALSGMRLDFILLPGAPIAGLAHELAAKCGGMVTELSDDVHVREEVDRFLVAIGMI